MNGVRVVLVLFSTIRMLSRVFELVLDAIDLIPDLLRLADQFRRIGVDHQKIPVKTLEKRFFVCRLVTVRMRGFYPYCPVPHVAIRQHPAEKCLNTPPENATAKYLFQFVSRIPARRVRHPV